MLKDTVALRCTVLLPVLRPPYFLPNAIESVLAQTVSEFELFVIGDGAPPETIECAREFARRDPRVTVFPFLKGQRQGEAHLHTVLTNASGNFVAYLEDDDLWFPNHLEELEKLLVTVDFGHTIHVTGHPDGHVDSLPSDLGKQDFRQRFLDDLFNRFGYSFCGHRLDAYRRLPEGWVPAPVGMYPDLHMWRKFFRVNEFKFGTRMVITAVAKWVRPWIGTVSFRCGLHSEITSRNPSLIAQKGTASREISLLCVGLLYNTLLWPTIRKISILRRAHETKALDLVD